VGSALSIKHTTMKNRILVCLLGLLALVFYAVPTAAQGFVEKSESERTREYNPSEGFTNVTLFELIVYGNESEYSLGSIILQTTNIQLDPSNFGNKISNIRVSVFYEKIDTSDFYDQDVIFDKQGGVYLFTNFSLYKKKFVQKFTVTGDINTNNLRYGDKLDIKVNLGMGIDGVTPEYYYPEVQSLIYRGGTPSSVNEPNLSMVNIFPNPFANVINVDLPKIENITLTNLVGETVYTGPSGFIETPMFPSGVYFIHTTYGICKVFKH
jgi:hypothetical protein